MASTDPIWQCVLLTGAPKNEASRTLSVDPSSMAKPRVKLTFVMSAPHGLDNFRVFRAERLAAFNAIQVSAGGRSRTSVPAAVYAMENNLKYWVMKVSGGARPKAPPRARPAR